MRSTWFRRFLMVCTLVGGVAAAEDLDRDLILLPQGGGSPEDVEIVRCQQRAEKSTASREDYERLGWAFVAKARCTQDAGFYKLAEKTTAVIDAHFGAGADTRLLRGHVLHNLHRFHDAEIVARALVSERGEAEDYALLSDALMEEGELTAAIEALQTLARMKPGAEASSRIAHLRWLRGDLPGALAAMRDAVRASDPRDGATTAWMLARLSGYELQAGNAGLALALADRAVQLAADFPPALLARGRALLGGQNIAAAVESLQHAAELNPLPEYQWWLADALRLEGREADARRMEQTIAARGATNDPRTFALFCATRSRNATLAVTLAREECVNRHDVLTHDALAWALLGAGDASAAREELRAALAEHTRDARLFLHAGIIARACGGEAEAREYFAQAQALALTLTPSERARLAAEAAVSEPVPAAVRADSSRENKTDREANAAATHRGASPLLPAMAAGGAQHR